MYNLYIYEKQLSERQKQKSEELKNKKIKEKRKHQIKKLFSNYCKRMDKFIISLCHKPIIIKDPTSPEDSIEKNNVIDNNQNFIFGDYMTDKKRVELLDEQKKIIQNYEDKIIQSKSMQESKMIKNKLKEKYILQPRMVFKPRTEFERAVEMINNLGNKDKKSTKKIFEKLKKLDIYSVKHITGIEQLKKNYKNKNKFKDIEQFSEYNDDELDFSLETNSRRTLRNKELLNNPNKYIKLINNYSNDNIDKIKKNSEKLLKLKNNILKELFKHNQKIYFKGASQYAQKSKIKKNLKKERSLNLIEYKNDNTNNNKFKKINYRSNSALEIRDYKEKGEQNNIKNKKLRPMSFVQKDLKKYSSSFADMLDISMKELLSKTKDIKRNMNNMIKEEMNNSLLDECINKYNYKSNDDILNKDLNNSIIFDKNIDFKISLKNNQYSNLQDKLNYLKLISQSKGFEEKKEFRKGFENSKKYILQYNSYLKSKENNDNEYVYIDGTRYNKKKDIKQISDIIFRKCNYYHPKSSHNKRTLVERNGKLSFTSGMSLSDFSIKYNL